MEQQQLQGQDEGEAEDERRRRHHQDTESWPPLLGSATVDTVGSVLQVSSHADLDDSPRVCHQANKATLVRIERGELVCLGRTCLLDADCHGSARGYDSATAAEASMKVLTWPPLVDGVAARNSVTLTKGDLERLQPGNLLNDNIIDFYLTYATNPSM